MINKTEKEYAQFLPNHIGAYYLNKSMTGSENFAVGIYEKDGIKYFAKVWRGRFKDVNYYNLKHEYKVMKEIHKKSGGKIAGHIRVPAIYDSLSYNHVLAIFYEFIEGSLLTSFSPEIQTASITRILKSLKNYDLFHTTDRSSLLFQKIEILLSLPLLTLALCLMDRRRSKIVIREAARSWIWFLRDSSWTSSVAHGDLLPNNILRKNNELWILDWEEAKPTFSDYDINYLVVTARNTTIIRNISRTFHSRMNRYLQTYIAIRHSFFNVNHPIEYARLMRSVHE